MILKSAHSPRKDKKALRRLYTGDEFLDLCRRARNGEITIWRVEIVKAAKYDVSYTTKGQ